jgi:tetraacyldisaccharide 4'-kinase
MKAPGFWRRDGAVPRLLAPLGAIYAAATARRVARPGWRAPVPVICCGNASAGGTGKTTLALELGARLLARGVAPAFLTRGYGGRGTARRVTAADTAAETGDEPLLLAALAPSYVGADRAATARLAIADGAGALVMDDGLQNPRLVKDLSILVIDGEVGFGNGRAIPAGPLREMPEAAAARCQAALLIGPDRHGALARLPARLPVLRAALHAAPEAADLAGQPVLAFAGIGRPEKFFATLAQTGAVLAARRSFPDHHRYTATELAGLLDAAERLRATPVTTPKDWVRLAPPLRARIRPVGVALAWEDPGALEALLDTVLPAAG